MALSVSVLAIVSSLHLIAFLLSVAAERRRSTGKVVPDEYDESTFCTYDSDVSTVYGLTAFLVMLLSQLLVNGVTRCLCFGRGLTPGGARICAICFFVFSWIFSVGAEACLLAGSAKNAYHTKYRVQFGVQNLSCSTLRKGVFGAAAALVLVSMLASLLFYWSYSKADTGGWHKYRNEGIDMGMNTADDIPTQKL
ncbi:aerobic coproporphyrinogen-III oxidase (DUF1218) [Tasmannia lanceolata]|uniref:aerobic coproporphyrinogen-III oxidase (DUF1218) n=1 Tax=Tasmannia lanceolata TaxID=3420 RepID=UPI004063A6A5